MGHARAVHQTVRLGSSGLCRQAGAPEYLSTLRTLSTLCLLYRWYSKPFGPVPPAYADRQAWTMRQRHKSQADRLSRRTEHNYSASAAQTSSCVCAWVRASVWVVGVRARSRVCVMHGTALMPMCGRGSLYLHASSMQRGSKRRTMPRVHGTRTCTSSGANRA